MEEKSLRGFKSMADAAHKIVAENSTARILPQVLFQVSIDINLRRLSPLFEAQAKRQEP